MKFILADQSFNTFKVPINKNHEVSNFDLAKGTGMDLSNRIITERIQTKKRNYPSNDVNVIKY